MRRMRAMRASASIIGLARAIQVRIYTHLGAYVGLCRRSRYMHVGTSTLVLLPIWPLAIGQIIT